MKDKNLEVAIFGGGCFWCTEAVFNSLKGIVSVVPGYSGGVIKFPTYEQVSTGATGHVEVVKIEFDSSAISYNDLLTVFFSTHDPTTQNRQGNDVGTQYRSVVFYTNEEQKRLAKKLIEELNLSNAFENPVVTELRLFEDFYPAEDYHQKFYETHKDSPYCQIVIEPKLEKINKRFYELLKSS